MNKNLWVYIKWKRDLLPHWICRTEKVRYNCIELIAMNTTGEMRKA